MYRCIYSDLPTTRRHHLHSRDCRPAVSSPPAYPYSCCRLLSSSRSIDITSHHIDGGLLPAGRPRSTDDVYLLTSVYRPAYVWTDMRIFARPSICVPICTVLRLYRQRAAFDPGSGGVEARDDLWFRAFQGQGVCRYIYLYVNVRV